MKKSFEAHVVATLLALIAGGVSAQNSNRKLDADAAKSDIISKEQQRDESADKVISRAAQNAGLQTCKPAIDKVNRYLIGDGISSGVLFSAPENANARIVTSSIVIENKQGLTYATASYSPYGDVACGVSYEAVTYWKESCTELSSKVLRDMPRMDPLGKKIIMLDGGPSMRMFLMPAGTGCVQIKKEVLH
jgi:hypothetical protein